MFALYPISWIITETPFKYVTESKIIRPQLNSKFYKKFIRLLSNADCKRCLRSEVFKIQFNIWPFIINLKLLLFMDNIFVHRFDVNVPDHLVELDSIFALLKWLIPDEKFILQDSTHCVRVRGRARWPEIRLGGCIAPRMATPSHLTPPAERRPFIHYAIKVCKRLGNNLWIKHDVFIAYQNWLLIHYFDSLLR